MHRLGLLLFTQFLVAAPFDVSFSSGVRNAPVDGRLILILTKNPKPEPRMQFAYGTQAPQIFGMDVDGWKPGEPIRIGDAATGHPIPKVKDLPPGTYSVQAVLHVYETVHKADGHTIKVPMDDGEGQHWAISPGNLYSVPKQVDIGTGGEKSIELTQIVPPVPEPKDTKYVRHFRMQSELLTKFWGRPMFLSALVLVPSGFDENASQKYPIVLNQGHFPPQMRFFREEPPPASATGIERDRAAMAYRFSQAWMKGEMPKMLIVLTQHATPFYDDSYGVNTANMGPYGDALTKEFYPQLEKKFRAIGESWARVLYGGSTGGWMTLAQQIFYPDYFGGTWSFCPDPVDFHAFQLIDVYNDRNAYFDIGPFNRMPKPLGRMPSGQILATNEDFTRQELALGSNSRSGGQLDAFHAVFGPVGTDGYPAKLWDPESGIINPEVAQYWREHYDLTAILKRDWDKLALKLQSKIHITMGTKDTFYLDNAVRLLDRFLSNTKPPYNGSIEYGPDAPHCWVGNIPNGMMPEEYYLPIFAEHMKKMAPSGTDTSGWLTQKR